MNSLKISGFALLAALSACSDIPSSGPDHRDILNSAAEAIVDEPSAPRVDYLLLDINPQVAANAIDIDPGSFYRSFGKAKGAAPAILIGEGDILQLTVFESKSGGLFIPSDSGTRPGNFVQLPPQTIDHNGTVVVPYAGRVRASGLSLEQLQTEIEEKLSNRAIEPKVIASFAQQNATLVSVVGEVNQAKKVALTDGGQRILDMIAMAGGIRWPGYETFVTLQRNGRKATVYFNSLVNHPDENIYSRPGDTIYVYREPRRYIAYGAVASGNTSAAGAVSQQVNFDQERVSLAEGVAKAGGLLDDRANPGMVFLYRIESRHVLESMGADLAAFPPTQSSIPTIYRVNFRDPATYFAIQQFAMRNKDILYVSNADSVEVTKFLTYVRTITSTVSGVASDGAIVRKSGTYIGSGSASTF